MHFRTNTIAVIWGIAEAVLFFIVPDVFLSWIAMENVKKACIACLWAVFGALLGGSLMYFWGLEYPDHALLVLDYIPAISPPMIQQVGTDLKNEGLWTIFIGLIYGIPYKIYAVQSADTGINLIPFLVISIPARLIRFALITLSFGFISRFLLETWTIKSRRTFHLISWTIFYTIYFIVRPN